MIERSKFQPTQTMDAFYTLIEKGFVLSQAPDFKIDARAFWGIIPFLSLLHGEIPLPPLPPALVYARCEIAKEEKALEKEKALLSEEEATRFTEQVDEIRRFWRRGAMRQALKTGEVRTSSIPKKNGSVRGEESLQLITREDELEQNLRHWDLATVNLLLKERYAVPVGYVIKIRIWQENLSHALVKATPLVLDIRGGPQAVATP